MVRNTLIAALAMIFFATVAVEGQNVPDNSSAWSGVLINSTCSADEAFNEAAKCAADPPGTKLEPCITETILLHQIITLNVAGDLA